MECIGIPVNKVGQEGDEESKHGNLHSPSLASVLPATGSLLAL